MENGLVSGEEGTPQGGLFACYRTSYSTNWIRSWSNAGIGSHDMRMTATFTSAVGEPANE